MQAPFALSRENHLNHMVKVVPLIVMGYAIQCYFIMHAGHTSFASDCLLFLGLCLGGMIAGFITYDLKHQVLFKETEMEIAFLTSYKKIVYTDIASVTVSQEGQVFSTLTFKTHSGSKYRFYFMDDADKVRAWLTEQSQPQKQQKAA